jgi:hypothetical protein
MASAQMKLKNGLAPPPTHPHVKAAVLFADYVIEKLFIGYALLGIALIATIQVFLRYTFGIA